MSVLLRLHDAVTLPTLLYNAETWVLNKGEKKEIDKTEVWAWKTMLGVPKTTPTVAIIFVTGALYASIRVEMRQLLYLQKVLKKGNSHWALITLNTVKEKNIGWAKNVCETLDAWNLERDWQKIAGFSGKEWGKMVKEAAELKNRERMKEDCYTKIRGQEREKTKTRNLIQILDDSSYQRGPSEFIKLNNVLLARAMIMGRYGMLQCAANFEKSYGGKNCKECGVLDDENHRINDCKTFKDINLYNEDNKIDYNLIYSENSEQCLKVVEYILILWDLGNGRNTMRCSH